VRVFGYARKDEEELLEMKEVTFQATPEKLRILAGFFEKFANEIENGISGKAHSHVKYECPEWNGSYPDIILYYNSDNV